ncbi:outer membrane beta-barrel protein [uncultured Imperialibacter sp.]|uniref:outer membrane beta-barrel protein n=1 Tax=uncultured Imperialibacter sp. TaxID=1672639 RepID=UPI0030DCD60C|tara:strand:- start:1594 stop:2661 length:1068 start_codon:yes stop_codon:yes gene_type:complete
MKTPLILFIALMLAKQLHAQDSDRQFTFSGFADVYYAYDFNKPLNNSRQYVTQAARHNEFNLNWGYLLAEYSAKRVRSSFGLQTGTYVQYNYAAEPNDLTRMIYQANAGVKIKEGIWVDAGIITPHTGYEGVASIDNEIYTRALGTEYTPYYLTGVKLSAAMNDKLDFTAVVVNGWQIIAETNNAKSVGVNLQYRPTDELTLSYGNLIGNEQPGFVGRRKVRNYHNAWIKYAFNAKFHAVASFDYGAQELVGSDDSGNFVIAMLIAEYKISDKLAIGGRVENMRDDDEILVNTSGRGFNLSTYSVTGSLNVADNAKLRVEAKYGSDANAIFLSQDATTHDDFFLLVGSLAMRFTK